MAFLEARARVLGAIAVLLAAGTFAATLFLGTDLLVTVPNDAILVVVVAIPGFLLGRTGITTDPRTLLYEAVLAAIAAAITSIGLVAAIALASATPDHGPIELLVHVLTTAPSWTSYGIAGYLLGIASTFVR